MSLIDKIKKQSNVKESAILEKSKFFDNLEFVSTSVPMFNVALSGSLDGGFGGGTITLSGASRSFKSSFSLLMAKSYLDKYPDSALLFLDSEFGSPKAMWSSFGIDMNRVLHVPITTIEELKYEVVNQLNAVERGEKLFILIDSIGNLPSEKEAQNAEDNKNTIDLTRNRELKSFFRLTTTKLAMKDIPMVVISHSYKTMEMFSKDVVSVGTGGYYASNIMIIVSRSQEKDGTELIGYNFNLNIEKSRFVREKSKVPIFVSFEDGISKWSGLMELALESGHCVKPKNGWYAKIDVGTGEVIEKNYRLKDTNNKEFWNDILESDSFKDFIVKKYKLMSSGNMVREDEVVSDDEISEVFSDEE